MCKTNIYLLIGAGQTLSSGPLVTVQQLERRSSSETIEPLRSYPGPRHPSRTLAPPVSRLRPPVIRPSLGPGPHMCTCVTPLLQQHKTLDLDLHIL